MPPPSHRDSWTTRFVGRSFLHPSFDYLLIGGGLSLLFTLLVLYSPALQSLGNLTLEGESASGTYFAVAYLLLLANSSHFAASTVRLYTKPGAFSSLPFLTMAFPLVSIGVLTVCLFQAGRLGPHLQALYFTWSPYHYAAQAYGLAVMYSFRSGCRLTVAGKRLLWWVAMLPFFFTLVTSQHGGLHWIVPKATIQSIPGLGRSIELAAVGLLVAGLAAPFLMYGIIWRSNSGPMPVISWLAIVANGIWFFVLTALQAFIWATIFHAIQYLAIVMIFHVRDQVTRPENRFGPLYHAVWFYLVSFLLGYGLFCLVPQAYRLAGFGMVESTLLVAAAINIHHFVVDAYIWRLGKRDPNSKVVEAHQAAPA